VTGAARGQADDAVRVAIIALGCPKNLTDSEVMAGFAGRAGFVLSGDLDSAEVIIVNTCAFIGPAREEAWSRIEEAAIRRRRGTCRALIVAGCLAEGFREEIAKRAPEVDCLLGTGEVGRVVETLNSVLLQAGRAQDRQEGPEGVDGSAEAAQAVGGGFSAGPGYLPDAGTPRLLSTPPHYAYIKIAEGCGHRCSFCRIPLLRGPYRSRPLEDVVQEARDLGRMGVKEIILVAQDTTIYGRDLVGRSLLADLSRRILDEVELTWLRVLYGYPSTLSEDFIALLAAEAERSPGGVAEAEAALGGGRLCRYLDLPMQHASDRILRAMRRPETGDFLLRLVERLRRVAPGLTLRSSFIVGFPGETDTDFRQLLDFLSAAKIEQAGFFAYSREMGTHAASLPGQVPDEIARDRLAQAATLQRRLSLGYRRGLIGRRIAVIIDGVRGPIGAVRKTADSGRTWRVMARSEGDAPEIDGTVLLTWPGGWDLPKPGAIVTVEITGARPYDLLGHPAAPTHGAIGRG
jgi:ribosomal protein S12 methylthiotransferase